MRRETYSEKQRAAIEVLADQFQALGIEQQTARAKSKCQCDARCFYCDDDLEGQQHDHDHFPIPARAGGPFTVATCVNCHSMKDRVPTNQWPVEIFRAAWEELMTAGPNTRILVAKLFTEAAIWHDLAVEGKDIEKRRGLRFSLDSGRRG